MPERSRKAAKNMNETQRNIVTILKIKVDSAPEAQLLRRVEVFLNSKVVKSGFEPKESLLIVTPNPEFIVRAQKDADLASILNSADISIPDGIGLILASWLGGGSSIIASGGRIASRVTGTDFGKRLIDLGKEKGWRVCLLGGDQNVSTDAKNSILQDQKLSKSFDSAQDLRPGFEILALEGPRLNAKGEPIDENNRRIELKTIVEINKFEPHLLFVGFGNPKQEKWINRNRHELEIGVAMGIGGAFDFWSGRTARSPYILRQIGLEWLWRLIQEPSRWRRQLALAEFVYLVIREKLGLS